MQGRHWSLSLKVGDNYVAESNHVGVGEVINFVIFVFTRAVFPNIAVSGNGTLDVGDDERHLQGRSSNESCSEAFYSQS